MQYKLLCWPPYFVLGPALAPPLFKVYNRHWSGPSSRFLWKSSNRSSVAQQLDIRIWKLFLCSFSLSRGAGCQDDRFFWITGVVEAGSTDVQIAWLLWVRVFKCLAQAHSSDSTGRFESDHTIRNHRFQNIALRHRCRVHICISKRNYRKMSCLGEHNTQGTSTPWVNKQGNYRICL